MIADTTIHIPTAPGVLTLLAWVVIFLLLSLAALWALKHNLSQIAQMRQIAKVARQGAALLSDAHAPAVRALDSGIEALTGKPFDESKLVGLGDQLRAFADMADQLLQKPAPDSAPVVTAGDAINEPPF